MRIRDAQSATGAKRKNPHFPPENRDFLKIFIPNAHHRPIR